MFIIEFMSGALSNDKNTTTGTLPSFCMLLLGVAKLCSDIPAFYTLQRLLF